MPSVLEPVTFNVPLFTVILPVIELDALDKFITPVEAAFRVSKSDSVNTPDCVMALVPVLALLIVSAATVVAGKASVAVPV